MGGWGTESLRAKEKERGTRGEEVEGEREGVRKRGVCAERGREREREREGEGERERDGSQGTMSRLRC